MLSYVSQLKCLSLIPALIFYYYLLGLQCLKYRLVIDIYLLDLIELDTSVKCLCPQVHKQPSRNVLRVRRHPIFVLILSKRLESM